MSGSLAHFRPDRISRVDSASPHGGWRATSLPYLQSGTLEILCAPPWPLGVFALIDNSSLGIRSIDVRVADEHEMTKVDGVPLLPMSHIQASFPWDGGMQFRLSICQFRVSPFARSVV